MLVHKPMAKVTAPYEKRTSATGPAQALSVPFTALEDAIWFRAACRLRRLRRKAIGLVGVGEGVDACDVALYLAPALVEACDAPVAVLLPYERAASAVEWAGVSLAR